VQLARYGEAVTVLRRGHELGSGRPDWGYPSAQWVAEAERKLAGVEARLRRYLDGEAPEYNAERLTLARLASGAGRHALAARLWGEALEADPELAEDRSPSASYRLKAARDAALVAAGQGRDDPTPDDAARAGLRLRALGWLKDELAALAADLDSDDAKARDAVAPSLRPWRSDPDPASVRDADALAALPEAERADWQALWDEADRLMARAGGGALSVP
jgi:hypothetical protein